MQEHRTPIPDRLVRTTATLGVVGLAAIAAVLSYWHMYELAHRNGETGWSASLLPLTVDGMILVASMNLLAASRAGRRGSPLTWAMLVTGSLASLAANVAVAEPDLVARIIAAWPSAALLTSYELLMQLIRRTATERTHTTDPAVAVLDGVPEPLRHAGSDGHEPCPQLDTQREVRHHAWAWALAHRDEHGTWPNGEAIGAHFNRGARWGRYVLADGKAGKLPPPMPEQDLVPETAATAAQHAAPA